MRRGLFRRKYHTNVKNGGAEWMEGRRKPVEVVCVDRAMALRVNGIKRYGQRSDRSLQLSAWEIELGQVRVHTRLFIKERG